MAADASRTGWERAEDVALGVSCFSWAALGLLGSGAGDDGPPLVARVGASAINLTVGLSFLLREPAAERASTRELFRALPSLIVGGIGWRLSGSAWPPGLAPAFLVVALATCGTVLALGRSFSVFPARRPLRTAGPYALVRHPLYLLELGLIGIAASAFAWWAALGLVALAAALMVPRIRDEERVLAHDEAFAAYTARVKFRLVPGVW